MKFIFIAKAPGDLAGGMAMRCAGGVAVGLPCLAEPLSQRQIHSSSHGAASSCADGRQRRRMQM